MSDSPAQDVASSLTRRELQSYLKQRNLKAIGTTESLREAYRRARGESCDDAPSTTSQTSVVVNSRHAPPYETEKRAARYRAQPTAGIAARIERATTQRLYLVERSGDENANDENDPSRTFVVLGSTGNVYDVRIARIPSCTCPDHARGNRSCKHVLFVLLKVIGLDRRSPLAWQAAYLRSELRDMFARSASRRFGGTVLANERVRRSYTSLKKGEDDDDADDDDATAKRKSLDADADCPICFDSLVGGDAGPLTFCRGTCGTNFHADCVRRWLGRFAGNNATPTCPTCRQPWEDTASSKTSNANAEGYANLGSLQGQSRQRDDSTYSEWYHYHGGHHYKRRRY